MTKPAYDPAAYEPDQEKHRRRIAKAIDHLNAGKFNATTDVTLTASATTTTVKDPRITPFSWLRLSPLTANASTAEKAGIWANPSLNGQVTFNHASAAAADQTFRLLIIG